MTTESNLVSAFTVQSAKADLSQPAFEYLAERGDYWQNGDGSPMIALRYKEVLPIVRRHFEVHQILWCWYTLQGWMRTGKDEVAWRIELPESSILACFSICRWDKALREAAGAPFDLSRMFATPEDDPIKDKYQVLIPWPLPPDCKITRLRSVKGYGMIGGAAY
jgi:hypothetical protein